eukprot:COSAG01_NODE_1745_length_9351_cov_206.635470_4_plen_64_part_00
MHTFVTATDVLGVHGKWLTQLGAPDVPPPEVQYILGLHVLCPHAHVAVSLVSNRLQAAYAEHL